MYQDPLLESNLKYAPSMKTIRVVRLLNLKSGPQPEKSSWAVPFALCDVYTVLGLLIFLFPLVMGTF